MGVKPFTIWCFWGFHGAPIASSTVFDVVALLSPVTTDVTSGITTSLATALPGWGGTYLFDGWIGGVHWFSNENKNMRFGRYSHCQCQEKQPHKDHEAVLTSDTAKMSSPSSIHQSTMWFSSYICPFRSSHLTLKWFNLLLIIWKFLTILFLHLLLIMIS